MKLSTIESIQTQLSPKPIQFYNDPIGFAKSLGIKLIPKQEEILEALIKYRMVMVESANGVGKSLLASVAALWHFTTRKPSITLVTAPTLRQVQDVIFKYVRQFYTGPGIYPKKPRIEITPDHYMFGFTATSADSFQGHHGDHLMVIMDEASGLDPYVFEASKGILIGGKETYMLALLNPCDPTSQAYMEKEFGTWHVISISAFDHPNIELELAGKPPQIESAIRLKQIEELIPQWSEVITNDMQPTDFKFKDIWYRPGPLCEARILGRYPSQAFYGIFSDAHFGQCKVAHEKSILTRIVIGCDPASVGDDNTSIFVRRDKTVIYHETYNKMDLKYTTNRLKELAEEYTAKEFPSWNAEQVLKACKKVVVNIDVGGIGVGIYDYRDDYNFQPINNCHVALNKEDFPNKRSENLFNLADKMIKGKVDLTHLSSHHLAELKRQAISITFKLDNKGRRVAEKKDDLKERLGRSPDDLDALALTFLDTPSGRLGDTRVIIDKPALLNRGKKVKYEPKFSTRIW